MTQKRKMTLAFGVLALLVAVAFTSQVQASDVSSQSSGNGLGSKLLMGFGGGYHSYETKWYVYSENWFAYPYHQFSRFAFTGYVELRRWFQAGRFQFSGRGELLFGFLGGTKEDWVSVGGGKKISSGGFSGGIALLLKAGIPMETSPTMTAVPYLASGVQFMALSSNGEDVSEEAVGYGYGEGWGEYLTFLPLAVGVDLEFERMVLGLDLRFALAVGGGTDWEPGGKEPDSEGLSSTQFTATLGFWL